MAEEYQEQYDSNMNTLPRLAGNRFDTGDSKIKELQVLQKKLDIKKQQELLQKRTGVSNVLDWKKGDTSTPMSDFKEGNMLSQQDYQSLGYGDKITLKDTFQFLFDGEGWKNKLHAMGENGISDGIDFTIGRTLQQFGLWFLFYFSVFSESIILLKMLFYTFFAWFYKNNNSENNKNNENMKLYSKLLITLLVFNLLVLPIILTVFFNAKYGLLK
jgi:hypothetical protein